ncbi:toxin-antitoxin system HicB family antitoxin [Virgibacillus natechei]|uniref:toxin-antitoxin system HicB family antitoxin n=1 Tax=Virgibacillus sp. CBA3643 TaxID=2942278 RepID=UPI0035A2F590
MAKKKNFPLRIDPKLYEALQIWAKDEFRSVNSHVEFLLRESVKKAGRMPKNEDKKIEEDEGSADT